jgi:hypothetical protein
MRNTIFVLLAIIIVIANGIIGHFFAPNGLTYTPIVIVTTTCLIIFGTKDVRVIWKSLLIFVFVAFNDILIKLYAGGRHDYEGLGWIHFYMLVGIIPSYITLLISIIKYHNEPARSKVAALVLFPILIIIHLQLFSTLGLVKSY